MKTTSSGRFNMMNFRSSSLRDERSSGSMPLLAEGESAPSKNCFRLVILGSAKVGKTCVASRFLNNKYDDNYTPTIEGFHRKVYRIRGEAYRLDILDTSGNDPFPAMRRLSLLTGDLFIVVYAIDCRETFEEAKRIQEQIWETKGAAPKSSGVRSRRKQIPMVIVGNKCDKDADREVGTDELIDLAEGNPGVGCVETSAKKNVNIEEIFLKLFMLAKLPTEMSPSLHRRVQPSYVGTSSGGTGSFRRGVTIRRRLSDACGAVAPNARRPSIRTDLLTMQTNRNFTYEDAEARRADTKCVVQ